MGRFRITKWTDLTPAERDKVSTKFKFSTQIVGYLSVGAGIKTQFKFAERMPSLVGKIHCLIAFDNEEPIAFIRLNTINAEKTQTMIIENCWVDKKASQDFNYLLRKTTSEKRTVLEELLYESLRLGKTKECSKVQVRITGDFPEHEKQKALIGTTIERAQKKGAITKDGKLVPIKFPAYFNLTVAENNLKDKRKQFQERIKKLNPIFWFKKLRERLKKK